MTHEMQLDGAYIEREREYWRIPGMAVILVRPGIDDEILCLGYRDAEQRLLVDENTQFCIASCSKSMTAALLAKLADMKKIDFDTPIRRLVPELEMKDQTACDQMTVRDMLCHRTGLGGHDALWPGKAKRKDLAQQLRYLQPSLPFRQKAQYSNLIYALAGYVAEAVTGKSWEKLMHELIFAPLSMERTTCTAEEFLSDPNHAEPYQFTEGNLKRLSFWNVDLAGPAASVNCTASDMAKWLHFHIDGGKTSEGRQLISAKNFLQMHDKQIDYIDSAGLAEDCYPGTGYCMGWQCGEYRGHKFQKHSGKIEGYSSLQVYLPDDRVGVGILMNLHSPSTPIFYSILYTILDSVLGYPDAHWERRFRGQERRAPSESYGDCEKDLTKGFLYHKEEGEKLPHPLEAYAGVYFDPGYGQVTVTVQEENLWLYYRDQNLQLHHFGKSSFWMEGVKEDILTLKVPVNVKENKDGRIEGLEIRYEPLVAPIFFRKRE